MSQQSSTDSRIALDSANGSVNVTAGAVVGAHSLVYEICEIASPLNCDQAIVLLTVKDPSVIDAVDDGATSLTGKTAIASVLVNDILGGAAATLNTVKLSLVSSTSVGVTLNLANGAVFVAAGTAVGTHALVYRICDISDPSNCDDATATVTVVPNVIDAVTDTGVTPKTGGMAAANVLANDKLAGATATLTKVTLALVSSTNAGVTLQVASGSVFVAAGTATGVHSLTYRICEIASPSNCDEAIVTVTVNPYVINAVNDSAKASSKIAGNGHRERACQRLPWKCASHDRDGEPVARVTDPGQQ